MPAARMDVRDGDRQVNGLPPLRRNGHWPALARPRPVVRGRSICVGDSPLEIRGVSYLADGESATFAHIRRDFASMAASGINALRTPGVPRSSFLDLAQAHGLLVLARIGWPDHTAFDDRRGASAVVDETRAAVRECGGHPALLGYAVGDEVPSGVVRFYGKTRVERFIGRLCRAVRREDRGALVTHVHYPSTEYLHLPFLDVCCFNVLLEEPAGCERRLLRLQDVAGARPLLLTELALEAGRARFPTELVEAKARRALSRYTAGSFAPWELDDEEPFVEYETAFAATG